MKHKDEARFLPPYPEHECEGCDQGKPLKIAPYSSIVGQGAIHSPEGWVCMKWMPPAAYKVYQERKRKWRPTDETR